MIRLSSICLPCLVGTFVSLAAFAQEFPQDLPGQVSPDQIKSQGTTTGNVSAPNQSMLRIGSPDALSRKFQGWWQVQTEGQSRDEGMDQGFAFVARFNTNLDIKLNEILALRLSPGGSFYSARLQQHIESDEYQSDVSLGDSFIQFVPVKWFEIRGGSLSQAFLGANQVVSQGKAFPGAMEMGHIDFDQDTHLDISLEQVVPTSTSLNTDRQGREAVPWFYTQSANFRFEPKEGIGFNIMGGHYTWNSLPSKIAYQSQMLGNKPNGCGAEACSTFAYAFDGVFAGGSVTWQQAKLFGITAGINHTKNLKAPSAHSDANDIRIEPFIDRKFIRASLALDLFYSETDVTPAAYTAYRFGNTNRQGYAVTAKTRFKKSGFSVYGQYVSADPVVASDNQFHMTTAILGVETDYGSF